MSYFNPEGPESESESESETEPSEMGDIRDELDLEESDPSEGSEETDPSEGSEIDPMTISSFIRKGMTYHQIFTWDIDVEKLNVKKPKGNFGLLFKVFKR